MVEKFIDYVELTLSSGPGGAGCTSFRREKFVPRGGPDGGDGGQGGNVVFTVNSQLSNFAHLKGKRSFKAETGQPGMGKRRFGKDGEDLVVEVPPGTQLKTHKKALLYDFSDEEGSFLFLPGGKGGKGNYHFKTSVKQTPLYAQGGLPGKTAQVILEIKLIADIGLVGFPNAGKSTLLSVLTNAHPKIANYPFTTLTPNLGVYQFSELRNDNNTLIIADIPGLIENSHLGQGLGIEFLRHIERTRELFFLIDITSLDPYQDFNNLQNELKAYSGGIKGLYTKEFHIVFTKTDMLPPNADYQTKLAMFPTELHEKIIPISSLSKAGFTKLKKLLHHVWRRKYHPQES